MWRKFLWIFVDLVKQKSRKSVVELILYNIEIKIYTRFWFQFDIENILLKIFIYIDEKWNVNWTMKVKL